MRQHFYVTIDSEGRVASRAILDALAQSSTVRGGTEYMDVAELVEGGLSGPDYETEVAIWRIADYKGK